MYDYIGFENGTGLLQKDRPDGFINPQDKSRSLSVDNVDKFVSDLVAKHLDHEEHVKQLMEQMDLAILYKGKNHRLLLVAVCRFYISDAKL